MKQSIFFYILSLLIFSIHSLNAQQQLNETLQHDGKTRQYIIYIPSTYNQNTPVPLMFNFHGGGDNNASQIAIADMRDLAESENFIVVYPQAFPDPNDGGSTNWLHKEPTDVDDVFFVDAMIATISAQYTIDANRIYACGYSLGGEFTYELACRLNEKIAAVGVVARTMGTAAFDNCVPSHPTGMLTILGTADPISPYEGLTWQGIEFYLSADDTHAYWANHNNANTNPTITDVPNTNTSDGSTVERHVWGEGDACATVEHLKVIGGDHDWPGTFGNMDINATIEIWNFVSQYDLTGFIACTPNSVDEELVNKDKIILFPNPVRNNMTIEMENAKERNFQVFTVAGNVIMSGIINSTSNAIDVSNLPSNLYFIRIGNRYLKFVK